MVPPLLKARLPLSLFKDNFSKFSPSANSLKKHNDDARKAPWCSCCRYIMNVSEDSRCLSTTRLAAGSRSLLLLLAPSPGPAAFSPSPQPVPQCLSLPPCGSSPPSLLSHLLLVCPTAGSGSFSLEPTLISPAKLLTLAPCLPFPSPLLSLRVTGLLEKSLSS